MFIHNTPIILFFRKHNTVKAAAFGSYFVSLSICKYLIVLMRCKLRVFGVILENPTYVFCDNRKSVKNMSIPGLVLRKKHNSISNHSVFELVAADIL